MKQLYADPQASELLVSLMERNARDAAVQTKALLSYEKDMRLRQAREFVGFYDALAATRPATALADVYVMLADYRPAYDRAVKYLEENDETY